MNVKGTITHIFAQKESGFAIAAIRPQNPKTIPLDKRNPEYPDSVSVVGVMKGAKEEYVVEVAGEWESRPRGNYWPWQLKVSDFCICELETPELLLRFLCELPNVSKELANRILCYFPHPQEIIEKQPERLTELGGIDRDKARQIHHAFLEQKEKKSLGSYLSRYGIRQDEIKEIASFYGAGALQKIKANPYRLCDDHLHSFRLCDRMARDLGFSPDAECRMKTAINHVLYYWAAGKGHVYLTENLLLEATNAFFRDNAAMEGSFKRPRRTVNCAPGVLCRMCRLCDNITESSMGN